MPIDRLWGEVKAAYTLLYKGSFGALSENIDCPWAPPMILNASITAISIYTYKQSLNETQFMSTARFTMGTCHKGRFPFLVFVDC